MGCSSSRSLNTIEEFNSKKDTPKTNNHVVDSNDISNSIENMEKDEKYKESIEAKAAKSNENQKEDSENIQQPIKSLKKVEESNEEINKQEESKGYLSHVPTANALFVFEDEGLPENEEVERETHQPLENPEINHSSGNTTESILKKLKYLIDKNEISNDTIYIRLTNSVTANKEEYDKFEINQTTKFSFVRAKKKIKWNKKPYSNLVKDVTEFFNQSGLHEHFGFEWTPYLLENETQKIELKLRKSAPDREKFEDVEIETKPNDSIKVILIFNENDLHAIQKIKEINEFKKQNDIFDFFPIFGSQIKKKEEALDKIKFLYLLGVHDTSLYFLKKKDDKESKIHKLIKYLTEDNRNEVVSALVVYDTEGYVRYIGSPEMFFIENLRYLSNNNSFTEEDYVNTKEYILNILGKNDHESLCTGNILLTKNELFDINLNPIKTFYEPLKINIVSNEEEFKKLFKNFKFSLNDKHLYQVKSKQKGKILSSQVEQILNNIEVNIEDVRYSANFSTVKRYNNILPGIIKTYGLNSEKKNITSFNFHLNPEMFEKYQAQLLNQFGQLRFNPMLGRLKFISISPKVGSQFPKSLTMLEGKENKEIQIELSESLPKLFLILRNGKNPDEKTEIYQYLSKIWNNIVAKDNLLPSIQIFLVYRGDSYEEAKELINDSFSDQQIFMLNSSMNSNFPFSIDEEGPRTLLILANKENVIKYIGIPSEISLVETLSNLAEGNGQISYKNNYPMDHTFYKSHLKKYMKELLLLIESSFSNSKHVYKPIIQFSFTKEYIFNKKDLEHVYCNNFRFKILFKTISDNIITGNEKIKQMLLNLLKEYGVNVKMLKIPCVDMEIKEKICAKCKEDISINNRNDNLNEFFFDQEASKTYCLNCEKEIKHYDTNLIYLKYPREKDVILSEVIQGFYEMNAHTKSHIENNEFSYCSICDSSLDGHRVVWMSLIHLNHVVDFEDEVTHPVLICDKKCFPYLKENEDDKRTPKNINNILYDLKLNMEEKRKLKLCGIDSNNLIFKKIKLT